MNKRFDNAFAALMFAAAVAVCLLGIVVLSNSIRLAETDRAPAVVDQVHISVPVEAAPLPAQAPAPEPTDAPFFNLSIPLDAELQQTLYEACQENDVPLSLALGVIQVESCFQADAVNPEGCYGLMQLHPAWFPVDLSPADKLQAGVEYLGQLLNKYSGDYGAALTAYNAGFDTGSRTYANEVLREVEWWEEVLK